MVCHFSGWYRPSQIGGVCHWVLPHVGHISIDNHSWMCIGIAVTMLGLPHGFAVHASSFGFAWQEAMKAEEEAAIREFQAGNRLQNWALSMIFSICNTDNLSGMRSGETMILGMLCGWNVLKCLLHVSLYLKICAEFDAFFWVSHVVGISHPSEFHVDCIFVHTLGWTHLAANVEVVLEEKTAR